MQPPQGRNHREELVQTGRKGSLDFVKRGYTEESSEPWAAGRREAIRGLPLLSPRLVRAGGWNNCGQRVRGGRRVGYELFRKLLSALFTVPSLSQSPCPVASRGRGADGGVTLPSSGPVAPREPAFPALSLPLSEAPSLFLPRSPSLARSLSFSLSLFLKKVFIQSKKKKKLALGKQPTLLELRDNNQFLWACEIGSLSLLFNRKYWKRLSLLY